MKATGVRDEDRVFVARVTLGLRELDGEERAPDVSAEVQRRLALDEPLAARSPWRWLTAAAALLAIAVTTAVLVQHNRRGDDGTPAVSTQDPVGASRFVYEFPAEALRRAAADRPGEDAESILAAAVACVQRRVGALAKVSRGEGATVVVTVADAEPGNAVKMREVVENVATVRALLEADVDLQMRIVADDDYRNGPVRFHLGRERERLAAWLAQPGNKERLHADLYHIRRFNDDASGGPEAFGTLAWFPRRIVPAEGGERWGPSYADVPALAHATVRTFDDAEFADGVSAAMKQQPKAERFLIELIALNLDERHFTDADFDPASVSVGPDHEVNYRVTGALANDYADWSEKHLGKCCAIVLDGVVRTAPRFESRIPGRGQIQGLSRDEATAVARLLSMPLLVQPEFKRAERVGPR